MEKRWMLLLDCYEGLVQKAADMLYGALAGQVKYVLPTKFAKDATQADLAENHIVLLGRSCANALLQKCHDRGVVSIPEQAEGYGIFVGESVFCEDNQMIVISGHDDAGVLYGCMDFCNRYLGDILIRDRYLWTEKTFCDAFSSKLNSWQVSQAPAVKRRALWTWGHVIYDYRRFFENMARLRLNEVVIWNDVPPLNAKEVAEYAHSLHIKVIWGFAWGWDTSCGNVLSSYDDRLAAEIKKQVLDTYESQYSRIGGDGIYFQSFTEMCEDHVGGKCVASYVTELVNDIAGSLLEKHPDLEIQFGLHATSVKQHLHEIRKVDPRVRIVWEDCGSFPYHYYAHNVAEFEETLSFTREIAVLRAEAERFGIVAKGMLNLDWESFSHFSQPYILGCRTEEFLKERQIQKNRIWKIQQADWLKNADYARRTVQEIAGISKDCVIQALVEDAMFENEISLPVALFAQMLWDPEQETGDMISTVAKYPCVTFANL